MELNVFIVMKSINRIIKEEIIHLLKEYDDYVDWELYEKKDDIMYKLLGDFLLNNTPDFDKQIYWRVVPAGRLKKIWEDYIKLGFVRDTKGLDIIETIMINAALRLHIITMLSGHTSENPNTYFEEAWGDYVDDYINRIEKEHAEYQDPNQTEIPYDDPTQPFKKKDVSNLPQSFFPNPNYNIENFPFEEYVRENDVTKLSRKEFKKNLMEILLDKFYEYYAVDSKGIDIMSDYGTEPLLKLAFKLYGEDDPNKKVVLIDRMLNIVHQRSDLASWFIEGGSSALSDISGYLDPSAEYSWNAKSVISGNYQDN